MLFPVVAYEVTGGTARLEKTKIKILIGGSDPTQDQGKKQRQKTEMVIVFIKERFLTKPFNLKNWLSKGGKDPWSHSSQKSLLFVCFLFFKDVRLGLRM